MRISSFLILFAILLAMATPARACVVTNPYFAAANFQLVDQAELIVSARIDSGPDMRTRSSERSIILTPITTLKGDLPDGSIALRGPRITAPPRVFPSDPSELEEPHPQAFAGACNRTLFEWGSTVLFFLERRNGEWVPFDPPFNRWAEDVPSADAPWVRAVRIYVEAAALPGNEQQAALAAARDRLLAAEDDPDSRLIATDINRQLPTPDRWTHRIAAEQFRALGWHDEAISEE